MSWNDAASRIRLAPAALLILLHGMAIFAGFFAPYSYRAQNRDYPLVPPTPMRFADAEGRFALRPQVYPWRLGSEGRLEPGAPTPLRLLVRGDAYRLLHLFETDLHLVGVDPPHRIFGLGTDALGRDYLSRLVYGGQVSLSAGLIGTSLALVLAWTLGSLAGYCGGLVDAAVMRLTDLFLSVPWLYILLAARAFLPLDVDPATAFLVIVALLGTLGWAAPARLVRSIVLSSKEQEFVAAAKGAGATHWHRLRRHVIPQTYAVFWTQAALLVPAYMLAEVTLSFIGLGVGEPVPSWGNMLASLHEEGLLGARGWLFAPAALMVVVGWSYHLSTAPRRTGPSLATRRGRTA